MSITAIIVLKIEDYEKFEAAFASRESERTDAGINAKAYRDMDDASKAVVIETVPSKEALFAFMAKPQIQQTMRNATIQESPDVTFLDG
ncbi:uncharacterized protein METZ01_LOCUS255000 [marine metagenome]|uniref:ABM domain-containing protein n=1 Tax=marine metagenome TaxID=408172 RepID=A0A382IRA6_9ZZZZ